MFDLSVRVTKRRIDSLVRELNYVSSDTFLRSLDLKAKAALALAVLKGATPEGKAGAGNRAEFGISLKDSWELNISTNGSSSLSFAIDSTLRKLPRGETVISSLNTGSRAYTFVPEDDIRFYGFHYSNKVAGGKAEGWVTLEAGVPVQKQARPGYHFIDKTYDFITNVMLPDLREQVATKIQRRMERV